MEALLKIQPVISLIISLATLVGIIIAFYRFSADPDVKASEEIKLINQRCAMLHGNLDGKISLIKNNHLSHIEKDIAELKENQVKMFTILDERLPKKQI